MAYEGDTLDQCSSQNLDLSFIQAVAVTGASFNKCGHLLLAAKSGGIERYFHVAGLYARPKTMDASGFIRYLKENKKSEIRRVGVKLPNPDGAKKYLCDLMDKKWLWGGLPNNCVNFVEEVIKSGGGTWGSLSNCPTVATTPTISERISGLLIQLENQVYQHYGIPR